MVNLNNSFVLYSIPKWFHFQFCLYEKNVKTTDISFSTNMSAMRYSSFTTNTHNQYLTRNLEILICHPTEYLRTIEPRQPTELIGSLAVIELRNYYIRSQMEYIETVASVVCSYTGILTTVLHYISDRF